MSKGLRIRSTSIVAILALVLVPLTGFAWYSYERAITREFDEVKDRHLLLAQNLSSALSRYERDVRAGVRSLIDSIGNKTTLSNSNDLMTVLGIESVALLSSDGETVLGIVSNDKNRIERPFRRLVIEAALMSDKHETYRFLPVQHTDQGNFIHVVGKQNDDLIIARLNTRYFVELGGQISFGTKGHAAIVDQEGNVLAHPLPSWIRIAKNISKVSSVQRMMRGETGIEQFYSPALKGDMIAGLTSVPGPGWGVMIPQPVSELYEKVFENLVPIFLGLFLAFLAAPIMVYILIRWLALPLENFSIDLEKQTKEGMPAAVPPTRCSTSVYELQRIFDAYNELARTVQINSQEMERQAVQDSVTGIGNRTYFEQGAADQISYRVAFEKRGVLIFMDLDGFKEINDIRGHAVGDAFLRAFAQKLYPATKALMDREFRGTPGAHPIIGRIGGDEFAILLPTPDNRDDLNELCESLRQSLPTSIEIEGIQIPCGVSAGGAAYPDQGTNVAELIRRADVALYAAKLQGKDQFQLYSEINALGGKSEILPAVVNAIENDELVLEYQPKYCLRNQAITGVEALLRWAHPKHGLIPPNMFLPAIQQTSVMTQLGEWVVENTLKDLRALEELGHKLNFAINIGTEHFTASGFEQMLINKCTVAHVDPARVQIEITEDVQGASPEVLEQVVKAIQTYGFSVAIDDFGKGFSNLSRLASLPVDVIKLDRSIVFEAISDPRLHVIMKSAIDMAHDLGASVILEGVETLEGVRMAEQAGADGIQGYYFSKSLPLLSLVKWLEQRQLNQPHQQIDQLHQKLAIA